MTTDRARLGGRHSSPWGALVWKAWCESRSRWIASLVVLLALVAWTILSGPEFLKGMAIERPDVALPYTGYVWASLFDFYLQGFFVACAFLLGLGGIWRERATGVATFTLSLPVTRTRLVLTRAGVAVVQVLAIALAPCLAISLLSPVIGYHYPASQSLLFGLLFAIVGLVFVSCGILLSSLLEGEYTALVVGVAVIGTTFFAFKARSIHRWSPFDVMSGARHVDPVSHLLRSMPWAGLCISLLTSAALLHASTWFVRSRDF